MALPKVNYEIYFTLGGIMPRPRKPRCIRKMPELTYYKPKGVALRNLQDVTLSVEGLEALTLVDAEGVSREQVAQMMNISLPTLCRILAEARKAVARALANGWAIRIEGGHYILAEPGESDSEISGRCPGKTCSRKRKRKKQ